MLKEVDVINYFKSLYFSPNWALVVIGLLVGGVCCGFGFWQLDRADEKSLLSERMAAMSALPALSLNEEQGFEKFRVIEAAGHYLPGETFYLDNMLYEGQPGYHVMSLFKLENKDGLVLVNRGWLAGLADRSVLPEIGTPLEVRVIRGSLVSPRTRPFFMGDAEPQGHKLRLYIDIEKIAQRLNSPVLPFVVQLQSDRVDGLIRSWPEYDAKVSMHIGYAVQWFVFAMFAFFMAVYSCFKKKKSV